MSDIADLLRKRSFGGHENSLLMLRAADEIESLRTQVAKLTEERDNLLKGTAARAERHYKDLTTAQDRITELEQCIKSHGIPVKTYAGGVAHYCMGDGDALDYRDAVIEKCVGICSAEMAANSPTSEWVRWLNTLERLNPRIEERKLR